MHYDYYIEPCQFCITRAKNGADISDCGWCGSGEDTRYRTSHEHPGDIVKIPAGGYGYPYHDSPHPERKYYRNGRHIPALDGDTPLDTESTGGSEIDYKENFRWGCAFFTPIITGLIFSNILESLIPLIIGVGVILAAIVIFSTIESLKKMK